MVYCKNMAISIINLPQANSLNPFSHTEFSTVFNLVKPEPSYITIPENPIVLACTIKRLRQEYMQNPDDVVLNTIRKPVNLLMIGEDENIITPLIQDVDRVLAKQIHLHYSQKLTWMILRGDKLSSFRQELNKFLSNDSTIFTVEQCKIAYKLPYFYEYDLAMVEVFNGNHRSLTVPGGTPKTKKKLTYINKLNSHMRDKHTFEYWFKDEEDNRVLIELESLNPLLVLWENHIVNHDIVVNCAFNFKKKDQFEYYYTPRSFSWEMNS